MEKLHLYTFDELMEAWKKDDEKKNLRNFIGKTIFKGKTIFHYHPYHALTHPWLIMDECLRHLKWAWQRVFRGWDDRVVWSIDYYLSERIPEWMEQLKEKKQGVPMRMFKEEDYINNKNYEITDGAMEKREQEYNEILDQIAFGFRENVRIQNDVLSIEEEAKAKENFKKGMSLFVEYFDTFWD